MDLGSFLEARWWGLGRLVHGRRPHAQQEAHFAERESSHSGSSTCNSVRTCDADLDEGALLQASFEKTAQHGHTNAIVGGGLQRIASHPGPLLLMSAHSQGDRGRSMNFSIAKAAGGEPRHNLYLMDGMGWDAGAGGAGTTSAGPAMQKQQPPQHTRSHSCAPAASAGPGIQAPPNQLCRNSGVNPDGLATAVGEEVENGNLAWDSSLPDMQVLESPASSRLLMPGVLLTSISSGLFIGGPGPSNGTIRAANESSTSSTALPLAVALKAGHCASSPSPASGLAEAAAAAAERPPDLPLHMLASGERSSGPLPQQASLQPAELHSRPRVVKASTCTDLETARLASGSPALRHTGEDVVSGGSAEECGGGQAAPALDDLDPAMGCFAHLAHLKARSMQRRSLSHGGLTRAEASAVLSVMAEAAMARAGSMEYVE